MYHPKEGVGGWQAFFRRLKRLLTPPVSDFSNRDFSYDKKAIERKTVARFSRGNARLQQGRYITREEIDERLQNFLENGRRI